MLRAVGKSGARQDVRDHHESEAARDGKHVHGVSALDLVEQLPRRRHISPRAASPTKKRKLTLGKAWVSSIVRHTQLTPTLGVSELLVMQRGNETNRGNARHLEERVRVEGVQREGGSVAVSTLVEGQS